MSAFTFDFDLEDDLDNSFDAILPQEPSAVLSTDKTLVSDLDGSGGSIPAEEITLSSLFSALPEAFSYSPITLPVPVGGTCGRTLVRRDLFDVRFQLSLPHAHAQAPGPLSERDEQTAAFVDAPADLVPGTYEGGLKTWECALDLAAYLDRDVVIGAHEGVTPGRRFHGLRVLELGCGTAVPTLLLLDRLFGYLASEPRAATDPPSGGENDTGPRSLSVKETHIHLQDYNRSVLELVTFPNVLLAWYKSPLSAEYRSSAADSDSDLDNNEDEVGKETIRGRAVHGRKPGGLTVTKELLDAFTASLDAHKVRLCFFAGSWSSLREKLPYQGRPPYDIVLASETIYRTEALAAFLSVLRTATARPMAAAAADATSQCDQEVVRPPLCLVAAKVLYFGVGGGVQGFVHAVEGEHGTVRTVWEHREGVGRIIMCVEW